MQWVNVEEAGDVYVRSELYRSLRRPWGGRRTGRWSVAPDEGTGLKVYRWQAAIRQNESDWRESCEIRNVDSGGWVTPAVA